VAEVAHLRREMGMKKATPLTCDPMASCTMPTGTSALPGSSSILLPPFLCVHDYLENAINFSTEAKTEAVRTTAFLLGGDEAKFQV